MNVHKLIWRRINLAMNSEDFRECFQEESAAELVSVNTSRIRRERKPPSWGNGGGPEIQE